MNSGQQVGDGEVGVDGGWRRLCRHLCSREIWKTALAVEALVLRNAAGSILSAWIPSAFCALGNIFSGKWYTDQSRDELMVAIAVWGCVTFCGVVFTAFFLTMLSYRYVSVHGGQSSAWFWLRRLIRATIVYFVATLGFMFATNCFVVYLTSVEPKFFMYRIDCYLDTIALIGYIAGIGRAVHQIYYVETQQGRAKLQTTKSNRIKISPTTVNGRRMSLKEAPTFKALTFWRFYLKILPIASSPILACVFVHVLSHLRIVDSSRSALTGFVIASISFKLAVQELAKIFIFKKRVRSARIMCVLVGLPTVLIDTQTRIILLGSSTTTATLGVLGMAFIEITLRAGKAALLIWEIRRRKVSLESENSPALPKQTDINLFKISSVVPKAPSRLKPSRSSRFNNFELWRRQVQTFHMAELNADMYAEYISIGCSASILFFYGNHPHYSLLRLSEDTGAAAMNSSAWRISQLALLTLQIGVEVVVDFLSIIIEVMIGIEFEPAKKLGSFLAAMFMVAAVMNSTISMAFYLS